MRCAMLLVAMLAVVTANQVQHMEVDPVKLRKMADDVGVVRPAAALQSRERSGATPAFISRVAQGVRGGRIPVQDKGARRRERLTPRLTAAVSVPPLPSPPPSLSCLPSPRPAS